MVAIPTVGYKPNLRQLQSELHQLLSTFLASKPFAERARQEEKWTMEQIPVESLEEDTITRLLLSTAITLRVLDDREDGSLDLLSRNCGTLIVSGRTKQLETKALTIRDACNKIIHAGEFTLERTAPIPTGFSPLEPYIHMRGVDQGGKKDWKASVSVFEFALEGMLGISSLLKKGAA